MAAVRLSVNGLVTRKAAVQAINKSFHVSRSKAPQFHALCCTHYSSSSGASEPTADAEGAGEGGDRCGKYEVLSQECPVHELVPALDAPVKCIHCASPIPWPQLHWSALTLGIGKGGLVAVCRRCHAKPCD